jgi:hypothetical protein
MSQPSFMNVALHIHNEKVQRGPAVSDVAFTDQHLGRMVVDPAAMCETSADQAAQATPDDAIGDAVFAGNRFQGRQNVLIRLYPGNNALAGGGDPEGWNSVKLVSGSAFASMRTLVKPQAVASPGSATMVSWGRM